MYRSNNLLKVYLLKFEYSYFFKKQKKGKVLPN